MINVCIICTWYFFKKYSPKNILGDIGNIVVSIVGCIGSGINQGMPSPF
jgi:hypothetical protein